MSSYGTLAHVTRDSRINAELLRTRLWHGVVEGDAQPVDKDEQQKPVRHLHDVAKAAATLPAGLLDSVHERRWAAATGLAARRPGHVVVPLLITPYWRVVVGHGENSPYETSLSFSTTYGVPIWPGSGLKGVAASHARAADVPAEVIARLFGSPRPGQALPEESRQGTVTVLDALPVRAPTVVVDVLTPHVKPYYDDAIRDPLTITHPPAEYYQPVPVRFLAVGATPFRTLVIGPEADAMRFGELLCGAADDIGLGGKTAAGYGYCAVSVESMTASAVP
jgi:CRISPR type III-B/RAMP module RAMP protein Cmr6